MSDSLDIIHEMQAEADAFAQDPNRRAIAAAIIAERDALLKALRRVQSHHAIASRDDDLMRRLVLLQGIIGGYGRSDEAAIIRALAELAGIRRETLLAVGQTRRRQADDLAADVARLTAERLSARTIALRVHRTEGTVRRLRKRARSL